MFSQEAEYSSLEYLLVRAYVAHTRIARIRAARAQDTLGHLGGCGIVALRLLCQCNLPKWSARAPVEFGKHIRLHTSQIRRLLHSGEVYVEIHSTVKTARHTHDSLFNHGFSPHPAPGRGQIHVLVAALPGQPNRQQTLVARRKSSRPTPANSTFPLHGPGPARRNNPIPARPPKTRAETGKS